MMKYDGTYTLGYHEVGTQIDDIVIGRYKIEFTFRLHEIHAHLTVDGQHTILWPIWLTEALSAWDKGMIALPLDTYLYKLFGEPNAKQIRRRTSKRNAS